MRDIAGKYYTKSSIYRKAGGIIPDDEPVFLFRAQDKLLVELLESYKQLRRKHQADSAESLERINKQIELIRDWQTKHYTQLPR